MVYVPELKGCLQSFKGILHAENVKGILDRQWSRKKRYVMKWKLYENAHIFVSDVEDVRLL